MFEEYLFKIIDEDINYWFKKTGSLLNSTDKMESEIKGNHSIRTIFHQIRKNQPYLDNEYLILRVIKNNKIIKHKRYMPDTFTFTDFKSILEKLISKPLSVESKIGDQLNDNQSLQIEITIDKFNKMHMARNYHMKIELHDNDYLKQGKVPTILDKIRVIFNKK